MGNFEIRIKIVGQVIYLKKNKKKIDFVDPPTAFKPRFNNIGCATLITSYIKNEKTFKKHKSFAINNTGIHL